MSLKSMEYMNFSKLSKSVLCLAVVVASVVASFAQTPINGGTSSKIDYRAEPKRYVVGSIEAQGLQTINPKFLLSNIGIEVGDSILIPGDRLSSVNRRLMDQRHFSDVKTETSFRGDTVDVTFVFAERLRVRRWSFTGTKGSENKDLQEKLRLRRSGELSDFVIMNALEGIKNFYDEKGFRNAKVDVVITPDSIAGNYVHVNFAIERNKRVRIGNIVVEGNENIDAKKLVKAMEKTKKVSINFFADTKFNEENYKDDKDKLLGYYRSKGYRDARIVADSIFTINDKRIGLWIKVEEGKKYYYGDITWIGNSKIPTTYLQQMLGMKSGDIYDSETMGRRTGKIQGKPGEQSISTLYRDDGHLAFVIEPFETVRGDTVDVEIRMYEGKQFRINEVNFEGNTRTNDHVIRRELDTRPGELYSQSLLMRTYQKLATMGQFDAESFSTPDIRPNLQTETVDIGYSLQEVSKDQFELSGGWGGGMFIASVAVNFTNVSLRKFFKKGSWRPYPAGDNQTVSVKFQSNGTYYTAGSISIIEPWLGGKKPTSLSLSFYTSRETNAYYWGRTPTAYFGTVGGAASIGKRLKWPDPFFQLSVGVTMQTYNLHNWSYFKIQNGSSNVAAITAAFGRNSIDDPIGYATRGSEIMLTAAITPPWSLFDGKDYSNPNMSDNEKYLWVEYYKLKFNARWFVPITADGKLVFMARAQFGYLGSYNKNKPSPFEGFQVGGDGLAGYNIYGVETVGLRGYTNQSLTPYASYGEYASVYSKLTAELRYPIVRSSGTLVYGLVFLEAGNAFDKPENYKPFNLKRSAGVGLRVYLPILGMLGVDWAYGFDSVPSDPTKASGSQFHFTMGMPM